jgi:hypothetical protein
MGRGDNNFAFIFGDEIEGSAATNNFGLRLHAPFAQSLSLASPHDALDPIKIVEHVCVHAGCANGSALSKPEAHEAYLCVGAGRLRIVDLQRSAWERFTCN